MINKCVICLFVCLFVCFTGKACAVHLGVGKHVAYSVVHDLETNVFTFSVAVQPEDKSRTPSGNPLEVPADASMTVCFNFFDWC